MMRLHSGVEYPQVPIIKGDAKSISIGAGQYCGKGDQGPADGTVCGCVPGVRLCIQ